MEVQLSIIYSWMELYLWKHNAKDEQYHRIKKVCWFGGLGKTIPLRPRKVHIYLQQQHFGIRGPILVR